MDERAFATEALLRYFVGLYVTLEQRFDVVDIDALVLIHLELFQEVAFYVF